MGLDARRRRQRLASADAIPGHGATAEPGPAERNNALVHQCWQPTAQSSRWSQPIGRLEHRSWHDAAACRWHPATLWIGIGCERNTSVGLVERAVASALARASLAPEAVAGISSIDAKADEPALLHLSEQHGWPFRLHNASSLAKVAVPTPSEVVKAEMGTASVAKRGSTGSRGRRSSTSTQADLSCRTW